MCNSRRVYCVRDTIGVGVGKFTFGNQDVEVNNVT